MPSLTHSQLPATETIIRPNGKWLQLNLTEILAYRDLLLLLVRRDFVAKYKQTVLGPLWFIIQPLLTTLVFTVIFGNVAKIPTDGIPPVLFYLCGLLGWNYFAHTFGTISTTFTSNAGLFGKVYFPRLVIPISATISNLFAVILNFVIFAAFWSYFHFSTDGLPGLSLPHLTLLPLILLHTAAISMACGLWMAVLTAKYRDLSHLSGFLVQLWLYATPVIYPLSQISKSWQWLAALNPMTAVVESMRIILLGTGTLPTYVLAVSIGITVVLLGSAVLAFNRTERSFIDTV